MSSATTESDAERHPVDLLAERYAEQLRAGAEPSIEDYCRQYPEHAELIRAVFPSVAVTERVSRQQEQQRQRSAISPFSAGRRPDVIGDFQLLREVGRGGMGVVYEALQRSLKRRVALKVVNQLLADSDRQLQRFRREAESAARLHHSNIVPVFGFGEDRGVHFYAMQLIEGATLAEVVARLRESSAESATNSAAQHSSGPSAGSVAVSAGLLRHQRATSAARLLLGRDLNSRIIAEPPVNDSTIVCELAGRPPESTIASVLPQSESQTAASPGKQAERKAGEAEGATHPSGAHICLPALYFRNVARLIAAAANALDYAHRQGILHRDIKPANLLLDLNGTICIADFGLARALEPDAITQTGEIVGTFRYMAPEQLRGHADPRTDVHALGLTLHELLTLEPPSTTLLQVADRRQPPAPRTLHAEIPRDLETIALKACMPEAERRYQTAGEFEADLLRFLEDRPITARRVTSVERLYRWSRRNPQLAALTAATLTLLLAIGLILGISYRRVQKALTARNEQYQRAESNLLEKTAALETASRERLRAEKNLELAIAAFEEVFSNIAARGRSETLLDEIGADELLTDTDASLSSADVTLLETLLQFFDRLAAENARDLGTSAADARRRVGDIQRQLGRFDDARQSYQLALNACRTAAGQPAAVDAPLLAELQILHQLLQLEVQRGEIPAALQALQQFRDRLEDSPSISRSSEGRYLLANALNTITALGLRQPLDPRLRPRFGPGINGGPGGPLGLPGLGLPPGPGGSGGPGGPGQGPGPVPGSFSGALNAPGQPPLPAATLDARLRRSIEANTEARQILTSLCEADPTRTAFRLELARATRDHARIAQFRRDFPAAEKSFAEAVRILETLQQEHPDVDLFQFELADALGSVNAFRPADLQRLQRSLLISRQLMDQHPAVPEYRSLHAATLARIAAFQAVQGQFLRAESGLVEAMQLLQQLTDQFPEGLTYQLALLRTQQQLATLYARNNRPAQAREVLDGGIQRMESASANARQRPATSALLNRLREMRQSLNSPPTEGAPNPRESTQ
ncbi:MAG: protein kinase domain-containing protein [Planctomycetota bacterium]